MSQTASPPAPAAGPTPPSARAQRAAAPADVTEYGTRRILIVAGVMAAALMQTLDSTITNVALPTIQGNLGASQDEGTWVITAYVIAAIVVIPLTPWLQTRFGRRNYFLASIVGFTLASIVCGSSESLPLLIGARAVQGAFGGGLLATGQSILRDTFPPNQLAASQGIFAIGAIMGPALGPPLGGYLVDNYSWNWCFDINVIPGIFATIVLLLLLKDPSKPQRSPIDGVGLLLLAVGLGTMQYVLTEGEQNYWFADPLIAVMTVLCVISLVAFGWWEIRGTTGPVVDLKVMRYRSVWTGSILAFVLGVSVYGSSYVLPQFTQGSLGYTPTLSGMLFILRALPIALLTPVAVRLSGKVDARILLATGFVLLGVGGTMQAFITSPTVEFWDFLIPLALTGAGSAMLWIPLTIAILSGTPPKDSPKAAAFTNLFVQLGGSVAVAVLAVLLHSRQTFHSTIIGANLTPDNITVQQFLLHNSVAQLAQLAYAQSTIISFEDVQYAIGILAFVCIPLVILLKKRANAGAAGPVHVEMG